MTQAYPLSWPTGVPRTERKVDTRFKTTLTAAIGNVTNSLRRFGESTGKKIDNVVISSNVSLGVNNPSDSGVAVWFLWDQAERCIAVDRYPKVEHNLQAIHMILEARVTEARHGGLHIVRQTFTGFIALPSPEMVGEKTCWEILGLRPGSDKAAVEAAHRELARKVHPDAGGTAEGMTELNAAKAAALTQVSS